MSDTNNPAAHDFLNYPTPKAHHVPYEAPPPYKNPAFSGLPLQIGANIIANVPLLPYLLWLNGGFATLRNVKELETIDPRYDPTVIPLPIHGDAPSISYTDVSQLRFLPKASKGRFHTIADFHDAYKTGATTPSDIIESLLPLVRRDVAQRSPHSTAFTETRVDLLREAAAASTKRWKEGKPLGILDGVPFTAKDQVDVKGYKRYTGTCNDYTDGKEVGTSWCVQKFEEQGAILIGKTNMHELGMDTTNNNPHWGTPLNPYNNSYYTGGSSGGPAYTVAAGLVPFTIGTDGGGSIRIPSNYCGLYGLKPSQGRVSSAPMPTPWMSVVVTGPLASSMADLEVSYRIMAQPDPSNPVSAKFSPPKPISRPSRKLLGICKPWFDQADPEVQEACQSALRYLTSEHGYQVIDIDLPLLPQGQKAHTMTILAETATKTVASKTDMSRLTPANKVVIRVGQQTPATDFLLAQRLRTLLMEHLAYLFQEHPGLIIVTPTTPNAGWPIGNGELTHGVSDANKLLRNMEYVWLANFTGIPCIQFPVGYVDGVKGKGKVPIGLSGHGEWGSEDALIEFGYDGEAWLHHDDKKIKPEGWVDLLA